MAQFIHLFDERDLASIRKVGIKAVKHPRIGEKRIYLFPQTENFVVNHQWMRELKRYNGASMLAARVRIPDATMVSIGRFNQEHLQVTAAEAIRIARENSDPLGLEVILNRAIPAKEIIAIYKPPKVGGWRYYPEAHNRKPCGCPCCQRSEPFSKKIQERYAEM